MTSHKRTSFTSLSGTNFKTMSEQRASSFRNVEKTTKDNSTKNNAIQRKKNRTQYKKTINNTKNKVQKIIKKTQQKNLNKIQKKIKKNKTRVLSLHWFSLGNFQFQKMSFHLCIWTTSFINCVLQIIPNNLFIWWKSSWRIMTLIINHVCSNMEKIETNKHKKWKNIKDIKTCSKTIQKT